MNIANIIDVSFEIMFYVKSAFLLTNTAPSVLPIGFLNSSLGRKVLSGAKCVLLRMSLRVPIFLAAC